MRNFSYRLFAFLLTVLLVTQACLFFSGGEEAPSPTDMPTTSPTRVATVPSVTQAEHKPEGDVDQEDLVYELSTESALVWALAARASSNEGEGAYQTSQALGERDTLICGLVSALSQVISGAAWQRCTVHFMRNILAQIAHKDKKQVVDALKLIFEQPDHRTALIYLEQLAELMQRRWPEAAEMLLEAKEDILVYKTFPEEHHRSIHSVNPLERLNREIRRRTRVVGVFPDRSSVYRLVGTLLVNTDEDWRAGRRYMGKEGVEKIFKRFPERKNKEFILDEAIIKLEAQNAIYTT